MSITTLLPDNISDLIKEAERIAEKELAKIPSRDPRKTDEIKTHQVRNFYSSITRIRNDWRQGKGRGASELSNALILIKPKLAYAAARNTKLKTFYVTIKEIINIATEEIEKYKDDALKIQQIYENFISLMEAIVAYHKFYLEN